MCLFYFCAMREGSDGREPAYEHLFTSPMYEPPVDSVLDLANSQLHWGATHDAWVFSLREATDPPMKTLVDRFQALPEELLHQMTLTSNFAFSIERLPAGHFAIGNYITEESMKHLRLMKEDIYFEHCILVFQKGSPLLQSFNSLIHRLLNSGLLLFWEGEVARKFLHSNIQSAVKDSTMALYTPLISKLQLSHFQGAFMFLIAGFLAALLAFIGELLVASKTRINFPQPPQLKTHRMEVPRYEDMTQYKFHH